MRGRGVTRGPGREGRGTRDCRRRGRGSAQGHGRHHLVRKASARSGLPAGADVRPLRTVSHLSASSSLLGPPSPLPRTSADPFSLSDGRPFDPTDASEDYTAEERAATARWVAERLEEREDEFLDKDEVRVWCGTFNVNDRQPKGGAQDVQPWVDSCDGAELLVFACVSAPLAARAPCRY